MSAARSLLLQADRQTDTHPPTQMHLTCSPPIARKPHIQSEQQPTHHDSHTGSRTSKTSSPNSHAFKGYFFFFSFSFFPFFLFSFPFLSVLASSEEGKGRGASSQQGAIDTASRGPYLLAHSMRALPVQGR